MSPVSKGAIGEGREKREKGGRRNERLISRHTDCMHGSARCNTEEASEGRREEAVSQLDNRTASCMSDMRRARKDSGSVTDLLPRCPRFSVLNKEAHSN